MARSVEAHQRDGAFSLHHQSPEGMFSLAVRFGSGDRFLPPDETASMRLFRWSAEHGHARRSCQARVLEMRESS